MTKRYNLIDFQNYFRGVSTIGQLRPNLTPVCNLPTMESAWEGVASSFFQVGNSIKLALNEFPEQENQQK